MADEPMVVEPSIESGSSTREGQRIGKLQLSRDEEKVLALYDKLEILNIELAIATELGKPEQDGQQSTRGGDAGDIKKMQEELLFARCSYFVRKEIVDSIMMASPIVKSVYNGNNTSPVEADLYPFIEQRDNASIAVAKQTTDLQSVHAELAALRGQTLEASRRNVELATELLRLEAEAQARKNDGDDESRELRAETTALRQALRASRRKWSVMKGTASAIVAGSGVDWVGDSELRELVLDPEDE